MVFLLLQEAVDLLKAIRSPSESSPDFTAKDNSTFSKLLCMEMDHCTSVDLQDFFLLTSFPTSTYNFTHRSPSVLLCSASVPSRVFTGDTSDKELHTNAGARRDPGPTPAGWGWGGGVGKSPWRRAWQSTPVFLSGESHGQRSLAGCRPWVAKS